MKKYLFVLFSIVTIIACEKENALTPDETATPLNQGGVSGRGNSNTSFLAKVDGQNFNAQAIRGIETTTGFVVEGIKSDGKLVFSTFGKTTGTYLSSANVFNEISYFPDSILGGEYRTFFLGNNSDGKIKITNYDAINNTITGTFSGYMVDSPNDSIHVTNGEFNNIPVEPRRTGEMTAQIGSDNFSASRCRMRNTSVNGQFAEIVKATADDSSYTVTISFPDDLEVGTYGLDTTSISCLLEDNAGNIYNSNLGELTISRADRLLDEIDGTFSFIAIDSMTLNIIDVKSGQFSAVR